MSNNQDNEIEELLQSINAGNEAAKEKLFELTYKPLKMIAERRLRQEKRSNVLIDKDDLLQEAAIRLSKEDRSQFINKEHFFAVAANIMRRVLIDHARKLSASKREHISIDEIEEPIVVESNTNIDILALSEALDRLEKAAPRATKVVVLRFFAGLSLEEIAKTLNLSFATVKRDWFFARTWLSHELSKTPENNA